MTPTLTASIGELADAAVARVHAVSTDRDGAILLKVLALAETVANAAKMAASADGDLRKSADRLAETVGMLREVAAEPRQRFAEPFTGVPLHLTNRALSFSSRTMGSA